MLYANYKDTDQNVHPTHFNCLHSIYFLFLNPKNTKVRMSVCVLPGRKLLNKSVLNMVCAIHVTHVFLPCVPLILSISETFRTNQKYIFKTKNQRTNGPVNAHLISWPSKAQNIQNLENIW